MIKIYGKPNCPSCLAAKNLLDIKAIPYEYLQVGLDFTTEELNRLAPGARSYPQVFVNGVNVGGYDQLRLKLSLIENMSIGGPETLLG